MSDRNSLKTIRKIIEEDCTEIFLDHLVTYPDMYGHRAWEILRDIRNLVMDG